MTKDDILDQLVEMMRDYFDEPDLALDRDSTAREVAEWDSLAHVNIIAGVESTFGVRFAISEIESLKSVGDLVDLVVAKKGL